MKTSFNYFIFILVGLLLSPIAPLTESLVIASESSKVELEKKYSEMKKR